MVYPGDPEVEIDAALTLERDGAAVARISIGSHTGTHVDAPSHAVIGGRTLDQFGLDELVGEALILHVSDRSHAGQALGVHDLGLEDFSLLPAIVVIHTGWAQYFGRPEYLAHPHLTPEAAQRLIDLGMRVLAIDTLSPDATGAAYAQPGVHAIVLGAGGLIVENLRGLEQLGERARIGIFPLPIAGTDGAPARVVAFDAA